MKSDRFPPSPQVWPLARCVRGCCFLSWSVGWVWVSAPQASELCCVLETACLLGDRFRFQCSLRSWSTLKMPCDLKVWIWGAIFLYTRQKLQLLKNKVLHAEIYFASKRSRSVCHISIICFPRPEIIVQSLTLNK